MSRERETSPLNVQLGIPAGCRRVARAGTWLDLVQDRASRENLRADRCATVLGVARELLQHTDQTYTARPGWARLAAAVATSHAATASRRTIARAIATLRGWGLLGVVATGRSGRFAPGGHLSRRRMHWREDPGQNAASDPTNEAAVYVLCQPLTPAEKVQRAAGVNKAGDENGTPPQSGLVLPPARARSERPQDEHEPLRGPHRMRAAQARPVDPVLRHRPGHWYPTGATTDGKDAALRASHELRVRLPVLRRISSKHVRSILWPFFQAGWTVGDVIIAMDMRPDGTRWNHDAGHGVDNVGAWLAHRLRPWTSAGEPRRSPSQRMNQEHAERLAAKRAAEERRAAITPSSPSFVRELLTSIGIRPRPASPSE